MTPQWQKVIAIGITLAFIVFVASIYFSENDLTPVQMSQKEQVTSNALGTYVLTTKEIKERNPDPQYEINLQYPQIDSAQNLPNATLFNRGVSALMLDRENQFKKEVGDQKKFPGLSTLSSIYSVNLETSHFLSVLFNFDYYTAGAAHQGHEFLTVNYDLQFGTLLDLAQLFKPGANYLKVISAYATADLEKQMKTGTYQTEEDMIQAGAGPDAQNFKNFTVTDKGLVLHFEEYQVGPYAAGSAQVTIPLSALQSIADPAGPLSGAQ